MSRADALCFNTHDPFPEREEIGAKFVSGPNASIDTSPGNSETLSTKKSDADFSLFLDFGGWSGIFTRSNAFLVAFSVVTLPNIVVNPSISKFGVWKAISIATVSSRYQPRKQKAQLHPTFDK
nr:hypothetical protein Iba_scaffold33024CG0040 [Ipomoea batatas]GMD18796.1 hypothetical protein Iba_scaffold1087843CG0010 [Ipomoea batatas]GME14151.1 hypothetical protein Iba_scaffold14969CG0060 [Ipomoea batatas]